MSASVAGDVATDQTTPTREEMAEELRRLDVAFVQAETLAHNAEVLLCSANDAYQAVSVARDAAFLLAGWRLGIPERAKYDGSIYRFQEDVRAALGVAWKEFDDLYPDIVERARATARQRPMFEGGVPL